MHFIVGPLSLENYLVLIDYLVSRTTLSFRFIKVLKNNVKILNTKGNGILRYY
jgi:hypothetical protein